MLTKELIDREIEKRVKAGQDLDLQLTETEKLLCDQLSNSTSFQHLCAHAFVALLKPLPLEVRTLAALQLLRDPNYAANIIAPLISFVNLGYTLRESEILEEVGK